MSELELLIDWLQARPNDAAVFATDDGFMCQTVNEVSEPCEAAGKTITEAIENWNREFGAKQA